MHRRRLSVAMALAAVLTLSACGSRVSGEEVLAGAGGGTVRLDDSSIAELRSATSAGTGAAPAESGASAEQAPATAQTPSGASPGIVNPKPGAPGTPAAVGTLATQQGAKPVKGTAPAPKKAAKSGGVVAVAAASPAACTGPGTPLKIGQIGAFSGVAGPITANARTALAAWVQDVNARGGLACRPIQLFAVDDGADPAKAAALAQQLVKEKGVVAFVGVFDAIGFKGVSSAVERLKVPVVGGDGIDFSWNENPYLFPTGAGILGAIRGALQQTVASGKKDLGLLYCVEASVCTAGAKVIEEEAAKAGGKLTYSAAISLTQPDFTAQCQAAKNAGVQAMGMAMDGASIGRVSRSCASIGYFPQLVTNGLVLSASNAADPSIRKNTLSSAGAVAPWMTQNQETPGQREYHAALKKFAPNSEPTAASITAWAAGKLFEAVIANLGTVAADKPITTADVMTGLGKVSKETLGGLTPPFTFKPGQKFAPQVSCVYFTLLDNKGWTAPRGSKPVCS